MKFHEQLKKLRGQSGMTQRKLAEWLRTTKSSIHMYERGEREPGIEFLIRTADFFDITLDELVGREDGAPQKPGGSENRRDGQWQD